MQNGVACSSLIGEGRYNLKFLWEEKHEKEIFSSLRNKSLLLICRLPFSIGE
ncbi:hypothetical protein NEOC84_001596|nr:hypothetical protein [Neochlamydia sp. AcF95]NGY95672.1 hypothetical protein [Neochlamydia sp. AcF84]